MGSAVAGLTLFPFLQGTGVMQSIYADTRTSATVTPFVQLPGGSVVIRAEGFAPNANATIYAKNVVAKVETIKADQSEGVMTFPDPIVVATTETMSKVASNDPLACQKTT